MAMVVVAVEVVAAVVVVVSTSGGWTCVVVPSTVSRSISLGSAHPATNTIETTNTHCQRTTPVLQEIVSIGLTPPSGDLPSGETGVPLEDLACGVPR